MATSPIQLISGAHPLGEDDLSARCRALARSWGSSAVEEQQHEQQHHRDNSPDSRSSRRSPHPPLSPLNTYSALPSPRFGNGPPTPEGSFVLDEIREEPEEGGARTPMEFGGRQEQGKRMSGSGASSYLSPPASSQGEDEGAEYGGRNSWGRYAGAFGGPLERMANQEVESPVPAALKEGATTLEVSVWLENGELLVGTDRASLSPEATLSSLYLDPLLKLLGPPGPFSAASHHRRRSAGSFPQINITTPFLLILNLRTSPSMTFSFVLHDLAPLLDAGLLTSYCPNACLFTPGLVTVLISASTAPLDDIHHLSPRHVFVEAPIDRLGEWSADVAPVASGPLKELTGWEGTRAATEDQLRVIREQVEAAHARGTKVRFSQLPRYPLHAREMVRETLAKEGVDIL